jgi:hypothetical protein
MLFVNFTPQTARGADSEIFATDSGDAFAHQSEYSAGNEDAGVLNAKKGP